MGKRTREWHSVTKNSFSVVESNTGEPVAIIKPWSKEVDERDARLIAAAPDLLEALELVSKGFQTGRISDASILPTPGPEDTTIKPIALSKIVDDAIAAAKQGEE